MMSSAPQAMPASRLSFAVRNSREGTITLRTAGKAVGRQRLALAPEHGVDRVDQAVDRNLVGIVVAADETVFGKAGPPRCRRRQSGGQQWREIEGVAADMDVHSRFVFR